MDSATCDKSRQPLNQPRQIASAVQNALDTNSMLPGEVAIQHKIAAMYSHSEPGCEIIACGVDFRRRRDRSTFCLQFRAERRRADRIVPSDIFGDFLQIGGGSGG